MIDTYPNSSTNTFAYNGLDTRVGKTDSAGTKTYRRDGVGVTDSVLSDGASSFTPGVSVRTSGASKFLHDDRLGTLGMETDSSQTVSATKSYDAFGCLISNTGTSTSPFGFAGRYSYQSDSESSYVLVGHRYYDQGCGRFLTRDRAKSGRNWYSYCNNNPLKYVDPNGLAVVYVGVSAGLAGFGGSAHGTIGVGFDPALPMPFNLTLYMSGGIGPALGDYAGIGLCVGYDSTAMVSYVKPTNTELGIVGGVDFSLTGGSLSYDNGFTGWQVGGGPGEGLAGYVNATKTMTVSPVGIIYDAYDCASTTYQLCRKYFYENIWPTLRVPFSI